MSDEIVEVWEQEGCGDDAEEFTLVYMQPIAYLVMAVDWLYPASIGVEC